jgi:hypothetical protein
MPNTEEISKQLIHWAGSRPDEVVFNPKEGYYSFGVVADAFEKGKEHFIEKMRGRFMENVNVINEALQDIFATLKGLKVSPIRVFIKNTVSESSVLITVSDTDFNNEVFVKNIYEFSADIEQKFSQNNLIFDLSFINDNDNLNVDLIKSDGYSFDMDLRK